MLAPLASLPGLMLPTACQWRRQAADDDTVDGECQLAWISQDQREATTCRRRRGVSTSPATRP